MSYILDALRKSEAERTQDIAPNLLTVQHTSRRPRAAVLWSLIAVLVLNAALIGAWLLHHAAAPPSTAAAPPVTRPPPTEAARADAVPMPSSNVPKAIDSPPDETTPEAAATPLQSNDDSSEVAERASAEALEVSSHVYSVDPRARAITISGRRFQEGDEINPGLRLVEITETGIVVDDHGTRRTVDVLNGWH